ncbi:MAG TPA: hypothetical protein VGB35_03180 [Gammaproteobacteria bacterium]
MPAVIRMEQSLAAWGTPAFSERFKAEIEGLSSGLLPLQQGLRQSSCVSGEPFSAMVIGLREESGRIRIKAGIFYSGIVAGCNCSDDPTPPDVQPEYCVVEFVIDRESAEATASLLSE